MMHGQQNVKLCINLFTIKQTVMSRVKVNNLKFINLSIFKLMFKFDILQKLVPLPHLQYILFDSYIYF